MTNKIVCTTKHAKEFVRKLSKVSCPETLNLQKETDLKRMSPLLSGTLDIHKPNSEWY